MNASEPESFLDSDEPEKKIPKLGRLVGIDFGTVRIGIAISDNDRVISSPLEIYQRRNLELDAKFFQELATRESIVGFVVGLPVHMSGDESQKSREATEFGEWLASVTELPVTWIDERFTTAMANEILRQQPMSPKKKKAQRDKLAAQIILRTYLESSQKSRPPQALDD